MAITSRRAPVRARLTSQSQITVPKVVRDALELEPGDHLEFDLGSRVTVRRHRPRSILSFAGIAGSASGRIPESADALDGLIRDIRLGRGNRQ